MIDRKRPAITAWLIPLIVGFVGLNRVMQSPGFHLLRTVDVVQLLGSGVCFGATLVGIILSVRGTRV
jgi:hypothetical protein